MTLDDLAGFMAPRSHGFTTAWGNEAGAGSARAASPENYPFDGGVIGGP
jgi:hypothetical protein